MGKSRSSSQGLPSRQSKHNSHLKKKKNGNGWWPTRQTKSRSSSQGLPSRQSKHNSHLKKKKTETGGGQPGKPSLAVPLRGRHHAKVSLILALKKKKNGNGWWPTRQTKSRSSS